MTIPSLDKIISDLESKIREGNFYDLYRDFEGEEILVESDVNELFIKDYVSAHSFQKQNLLCITVKFTPAFHNKIGHMKFRFTMDFPRSSLKYRYYRCATTFKIVSVSERIGDCFDGMWIKIMAAIHDRLSNERSRALGELSMLRNFRKDKTNQLSLLPLDLHQYVIGPMLFFADS